MRQRIAHEVHPAALPSGLQNLGRSRLQALMGIGDQQAHPAQPTAHQAAQELRPERLGLAGPTFMPITWRCLSVFTATATITATLTDAAGLAPLDRRWRRSTGTASRLRSRGFRNAPTRSSNSAHSRETWLLEMPLMPMALTSSSTECRRRTNTPRFRRLNIPQFDL